MIQTFVHFGMSGLTDWKRGALAVAPFAQAFREDLPVRVQYNVGAEFPFREPAPAEFYLDGARVRHFPSPTSHLYDVTLAPSASGATSGGSHAGEAARAVRRWTRVMMGLGVAILLTLGALIFLIVHGLRRGAFEETAQAGAPDMERFREERTNPGPSQSPGQSETERG